MNSQQTLDYALRYIARGLIIFPLHSVEEKNGKLICTCGNEGCTDSGKHPRTQRGLREASKDEATIRGWFGPDAPKANIGLVTGEVSGITVLDIDIGLGKSGAQTWAEINKEAGEPVTLVQRTGSGGMHFLFRYNSALNTSSGTLGPGVDCRNDKGYIVVAPSLHRSGGVYEWDTDFDSTEIANLPKHLSKKTEKRGRKKLNDPSKKKYTIEQVAAMLKFIKADDRDLWRNIGVILGREFNRAEEAWKAYNDWADSWGGTKGRGHEDIMRECFYEISQKDGDLGLGTIVFKAIDGGWVPETGSVPLEQFLYFAPGNNFVYRPTGAFWPGESIDASCSQVNVDGQLVKASVWLKQNKLVTSMTIDPIIEEEVSKGFDCREGALIPSAGAALFNAYRKPTIELGDARLAKPFIEHVQKVFNKVGDAEMFLDYMAHRVQHPGEKVRFALLIAGEQGVGKDTAISMCMPALGVWNVSNIEPSALDQGFNEFESAVLVVISEAANAHEMSKWAFNERTKVLIAGLPDFVTINPKYGQKFSVRRHSGVIITTNHMIGGIYIPDDDRRYDVIEAATRGEMNILDRELRSIYFNQLWDWFHHEDGDKHIAAYLHDRDVSKFNPATSQRSTVAHKTVISAGWASDEYVLDALHALGDAPVIRMDVLWQIAEHLAPGEMSRKEFNAKAGHTMSRLGYARLPYEHSKDGRWTLKDDKGVNRLFVVYYHPEKVKPQEAADKIPDLKAPF
jgi:hypothetical protein